MPTPAKTCQRRCERRGDSPLRKWKQHCCLRSVASQWMGTQGAGCLPSTRRSPLHTATSAWITTSVAAVVGGPTPTHLCSSSRDCYKQEAERGGGQHALRKMLAGERQRK